MQRVTSGLVLNEANEIWLQYYSYTTTIDSIIVTDWLTLQIQRLSEVKRTARPVTGLTTRAASVRNFG